MPLSKAFETDEILLNELVGILAGADDPSAGLGLVAPIGSQYLRTNGEQWQKTGAGDTDWTLNQTGAGGPGSDELVGVSATDTTPGYLLDKITVANQVNTLLALELNQLNPGADEDLEISFDETKLTILEAQISDLGDYVDLTSPQTISGQKTFTAPILADNINETAPGNGVALGGDAGNGFDELTWDGERLIFSAALNTFDDMELGYIDTQEGFSAFGLGRVSVAGSFWFMPRAVNPQLIAGDNSDTGTFFFDGNGNKDILFQALDTGPGTSNDKRTGFGEGGIFLLDVSGNNEVAIRAPELAADYLLILPEDDGDAGQALRTDGAGVLSWADYVTLDTAQTITGQKTFSQPILADDIQETAPGNGVTLGADPGAGFGTVLWDGRRLLFDDAINTFDQLEFGYIDNQEGGNTWGVGRTSAGGTFWLMPGANFPQILAGDNQDTGTFFFDANGNKDILFNALDTGPGTSNDKRTGFGEGGIFLLDVSGNNEATIRLPELSADYLMILPPDMGTVGQTLVTDGVDTVSWGGTPELTAATNGFVDGDAADAVLTYTEGTRTFEIAPGVSGSFDIYNRGNRFTISAAQSVVWDNTTGVKLFYFDSTGTLQVLNATGTPSDAVLFIIDECAVAYLYWNATETKIILSGPEFHGISMDSQTHLYNHSTFGARFGFGLLPFNVIDNGNGDVDAHAQFAIEAGEIWDEDIQIAIPSLAVGDTTWTVLWREGTGWNGVDNHPFPVWNGPLPSPDRAFWNEETSPGVWAAVELTNDSDFVLYHIYATNDPDRPFVSVMGQGEYLNGGQARAAAPIELLNIEKEGLPTFEFKAVATFIFQTNDGAYTNQVHSRIRPDDDGNEFVDWRLQPSTGST